MASLDEETKTNLEILKSLDEAIQTGPWEHNLFLMGVGKKLRELRERFQQEAGLGGVAEDGTAAQQALGEGEYFDVYISLYQAEGNNIRKWFGVVTSLAGHSVSRPVYKKEEDIQAAIRAKEYKQNDAYIVVKIREKDLLIIPGEKPRLDREGRELLILKENAVKLENIIRFVHLSGEYILSENTLVKQIK